MKLSQKRSCNSCKALMSKGYTGSDCCLGYKIEDAKVVFGTTVAYKPTEPCPKPLNNNDLCDATKHYKNTRH